jgi:crossover junction endodeoxyribonuclease RusA
MTPTQRALAIKLTLPYPPGKNHLHTCLRNRKVLSREGRDYMSSVEKIAATQRVKPLEGPLAITVNLYRPQKSGDLDGRLPALLDSLTGVAWHDDKQVVRIIAERFDDKANPRAEVTVTAA